MTKPRLKKVFIITLSVVLAVVVLLMLFLSPLAKYLLEKHGKDLFGRELKMDWAFVNPFTGYAYLGKPRLYEEQGDSTFLSVKGVHGKIGILKLFSRTVEITELTFEQPKGKVVQNKKVYNIDDVIEKFRPHKSSKSSAWSVEVTSLKIVDGEFRYIDKVIPINYFIKKVNMESFGRLNQGDTISSDFSFFAGIGTGDMRGKFTINTKSDDYRFAVVVHDFDLEIIRQYIWELINYGMFTAHLDANLRAKGNFHSKENMSSQGRLSLRDFHLGKTVAEDYWAFRKLVFVIEDLSPEKRKYLFDSILLSHPFIKYERYDSLDNIETLFGKKGKNITDITQQPGRFNLVIEIARYVKEITNNFFRSDYKIGRLQIDQGDFRFNDYSISEKFSINLKPFSIFADSVNKFDRRVQVVVQSGIKPYGNGSIQLSMNPKDTGDFDMGYHFQKIPASVFNPYLVTYSSFPLDRGTVELNGTWKVRNGIIQSNNHLVVVDPRVSKRVKNKDMKWLPMPLIMTLIREEGNVIDYEIPITGNLKNPKFHLRDVIFDLVKNILVKPPTAPYRLEVKDLETEIEKSLTVKWEMRQRTLRPAQVRFINRIADFFKENKDATISVYPITYDEREKEYILFFEAKKKYFILSHYNDKKSFSREDSVEVEKMSVKDPTLVRRLSKGLSDTVMFTLHEKCLNFIGSKIVTERFNQLVKERDSLFISYFKRNGTEKQVTIHKNVNEIPYNGFSYFRLKYEEEIPKSLQKAYRKMIELNDEEPRKQYIRYRKKERAALDLKTRR